MTTRADQQAFGFAQTKYDDDDTPIGDLSRPGLTKREYFAAMALAGLEAANFNTSLQDVVAGSVIAELAVERADALIAALNEERPD